MAPFRSGRGNPWCWSTAAVRTGADVLALAQRIRDDVFAKYDVG